MTKRQLDAVVRVLCTQTLVRSSLLAFIASPNRATFINPVVASRTPRVCFQFMRPLSNRAQHSQQKLPDSDTFEPSRGRGPESSSTPSPKRQVASSTKSVSFLVSVHALVTERHNLELRSERLLRVLLRWLFRRLAHKATDNTDSLARKGPRDSVKPAHQMSVDEQQLNSLIQVC